MNKPTAKEKNEIVDYYKKAQKRINFNGYLYLDILKKDLNEYIECKNKSEKLYRSIDSKEWLSEYFVLQNKMKNKEVIVITFSAIFLECLIWDYAAVNTSQTLTENALEKLNLLAKWKVIPKLANSDKKININSNAIHLLDNLVKERNIIVHNKSKSVPDTYEELMKHKDTSNAKRKITVNEAYQCVIDCTEGLKKVDTTDYWFFQGNAWDSYKNS